MDSLNINVINDDEHPIPSQDLLLKCLQLVADKHHISHAEVNVSIVSNDEIQRINKQFRNKDKPTNIISFEFEKPQGLPDDITADFLGDIIIAPMVLEKEAKEQKRNSMIIGSIFLSMVCYTCLVIITKMIKKPK